MHTVSASQDVIMITQSTQQSYGSGAHSATRRRRPVVLYSQSTPGKPASLFFTFTWPLEFFHFFEFKIRLIRLGLSFQKQKFLYSNSQPPDSQSGVITITPKSQLWVRDTEKPSVTFSRAWQIVVEFTLFYYYFNPIQNRTYTIDVSKLICTFKSQYLEMQLKDYMTS